jgi:hypothetical protein
MTTSRPWTAFNIDGGNNMNTVFILLADLWSHVGPGLLLAFALPVLLMLGGVILLQGSKRVRDRVRRAQENA